MGIRGNQPSAVSRSGAVAVVIVAVRKVRLEPVRLQDPLAKQFILVTGTGNGKPPRRPGTERDRSSSESH